jgi:hypothetical protein
MSTDRLRPVIVAAALMWLGVVGVGLGKLWGFAQTPGPAAAASESWPAASHIARDEHRPTLVVFAHPQCGCSRATVGELALLMAHAQGRVATRILFYRPSDADPGWERTDLWSSAAAISGVQVTSDEDGAEAMIFGAAVSGQALLYDVEGRLIFSGGITAARGHSGDNAGRSALVSLLTNDIASTTRTPVFGCFLRDAPAP